MAVLIGLVLVQGLRVGREGSAEIRPRFDARREMLMELGSMAPRTTTIVA